MNNNEFKIKTSIHFPLIKTKVNIKYDEIKKASGIAFILLEIIEKESEKQQSIEEKLLKFGIPKSIHHIFFGELYSLISRDVIKLTVGYDPSTLLKKQYYHYFRIQDFALTEKGQKLFIEQAIPTGETKNKATDIYYYPVTRQYSLNFDNPYLDITKTYLPSNFMDRVPFEEENLFDYIKANPSKMGIKKEERIVDINVIEKYDYATKYDDNIKIILKPEGVDFELNTTDDLDFFNKYYTGELMTDALLEKNKFKFPVKPSVTLDLNQVTVKSIKECSNIYLPEDTNKAINNNASFLVNTDDRFDIRPNTKQFNNKVTEYIKNQFPIIRFVKFTKDNCYFYLPACVNGDCLKINGKFKVNLLLELKASEVQLTNILDHIFKVYIEEEPNEDTYAVINYIVSATNNKEYFNKYIEKAIDGLTNPDDKIEQVSKLNREFKLNPLWKDIYNEYISTFFNESINEVKIENLQYKYQLLKDFRSILNYDITEFIKTLISAVRKGNDQGNLFYALASAGADDLDVLGVINIIPVYMNNVLNNQEIDYDNKLAKDFDNLRLNLWEFNDLVGFKSLKNYTIKQDINIDKFFDLYSTIKTILNNLKKYKAYAINEFNLVEDNINTYDKYHDILSIEKNASANPNKISKEYINNKLNKADYKNAICDLWVKFQFVMRDELKLKNATAEDLVNECYRNQLINLDEKENLHLIRKIRNNYQHPQQEEISFGRKDIEKCMETVFRLCK